MKTNEQLQAEIAKLEFDRTTQPNADWEPIIPEAYVIFPEATLELFGE